MPFSNEQMAAAMAAAPDKTVADADNPPTEPVEWDDATVSRSLPELREQLAQRRRDPQEAPVKVPTTIRFDADLLEALNDALREWLEARHLIDQGPRKR
jgi:uncharacterized protein (DUF4415 family)